MLISLKGYKIFEKLCERTKTIVYRGERIKDCQKVAIELFKHQYPTISDLNKLRNQYIITKNLNLEGAIATYGLESNGSGLALVMEDFAGIPLLDYCAELNYRESLTQHLTEFWQIALQIAQVLDQLNQHQIVHQKIQPQSILINPDTKQIKLTDFSLAALLPKNRQLLPSFSFGDRTLPYISPEQTGRINRGIDRRTDFYSLGVTFYQLLTGQLPFTSKDGMELVHSHLASAPVVPKQLNPHLPNMLSAMILKLMAKNLEDRYQTALGLKYDLEQCQQQWREHQCITNFTLGMRDVSDRLKIPQKLYGREQELEVLLGAYERVCQGNREIIMVSGFSGIGKTALIREIHQPIIRQQGYFIEGKFDQFQRNRPLSAIVDALRHLIRQLQIESQTRLQQWHDKLTAALGDNGQIIIDVIPELEQIIGKQPPVRELEAALAQNRFNVTFSKLIRTFATKERPLVIFLDDLQWADLASLKLLQLLIGDRDTSYLLLIGAYRNNEASASHPLVLQLEEISHNIRTLEDAAVAINHIDLAPLDRQALNRMIADILSCSEALSFRLTEIIWSKTQGNPFLTRELLDFLSQKGLISYDRQQGCWQCDIAKVKILTISDDVVEFMISRIQELSDRSQQVLKIAACMGNQFNLDILAIAYGKSEVDTAIDLRQALQEGFILPVSEIYKLSLDCQSASQAEIDPAIPYQFLHDRVQQAAYWLIPEAEKITTHYQIGNLLLDRTPPEARNTKIFAIVNHLNLAMELIQDGAQRKGLAELNLTAGIKAKDVTAYDRAWNYFSTGLKLLPLNSWQSQYELTLALSLAAAETAYLKGDLALMDELITDILQHGRSLLDQVKAHEVQIHAQIAQGKPLAAVKIALKVLNSLGMKFPLKPSKLRIMLALAKTKLTLIGKRVEDLIDLPLITDPDLLAAGKIMILAGSSAYSAAVELVPLLALKGINLSVKYGNAPISAYAYAGYSIILCGYLGDIEAGYNFGKLALDLVDKLNAQELKAKIIMMFNNFVRHWKEHILDGLPSFKEAYAIGLETGDLEFAAYSAYMYCYHSYFAGRDLKQLADEMQTYGERIGHCGQEKVLRLHQVYHQATLNLLGETQNPYLLIGQVYDEENNLPLLLETNHRSALFDLYFHKLMFYYWFGRYQEAEHCLNLTEQYLDSAISTPSIPIFNFYSSLVLLALYDPPASQSDTVIKKVTKNQQKLQKWGDCAPMNYLHKYYLVAAEKHRVLKEYPQAIKNYDRAIKLAKNNQYLNEQALAQELAAKFYLEWGKATIARTYLIDAYYSYAHWGAKAKIDNLLQNYPQLLDPIFNSNLTLNSQSNQNLIAPSPVQGTPPAGSRKQFTSQGAVTRSKFEFLKDSSRDFLQGQTFPYLEFLNSNNLDLTSIIKTSQAISQEIQIDKLLSTLMKVTIENSGAEIGRLILFNRQKQEKLIILAEINNSKPKIKIKRYSLEAAAKNLPISIVNYVKITAETVIVDQAAENDAFVADPYIIQNQPQSILCIPIVKQHKLIGILYLENNLMSNVFTCDRLEVLNILCSQATISLENAHLYFNLKRSQIREQQKTKRLEKSLQQLQDTQAALIKTQQQLEHDAFHDSLTGLPNRAFLGKLLEKAINLAARNPNYQYAFMFLDLDRFKIINDSLGHLIGDELLKQVAQRLKICLRNTDTVSRLAGDEFAILLEEIESEVEVTAIAQRIQEQFAQPFLLDKHEVYAGTSIGITFSTFKYQHSEDILRDADAAMYRAKSQGKGRYIVFNPTMQTNDIEELQLENTLRWAIARQQFCLHYQPIVSTQTLQVVGFEALIRWNHPTKGLILPDDFIPVAEETELINNIGWWVIQSACDRLRTWRDRFPQKQIIVNVNLSTVQLKQENILERLEAIWREYQLPDFSLRLEITESCILETFTSEAKILMRLKELGIGLCIDDFGIGYSSLAHLHEFPIDTLKIDRSFISRLGGDSQHSATIQTIVTLAHSLHMDVVAEGVETTEQLEQLQKLNCEYIQGYLFSKPLDDLSATQLLEDV